MALCAFGTRAGESCNEHTVLLSLPACEPRAERTPDPNHPSEGAPWQGRSTDGPTTICNVLQESTRALCRLRRATTRGIDDPSHGARAENHTTTDVNNLSCFWSQGQRRGHTDYGDRRGEHGGHARSGFYYLSLASRWILEQYVAILAGR